MGYQNYMKPLRISKKEFGAFIQYLETSGWNVEQRSNGDYYTKCPTFQENHGCFGHMSPDGTFLYLHVPEGDERMDEKTAIRKGYTMMHKASDNLYITLSGKDHMLIKRKEIWNLYIDNILVASHQDIKWLATKYKLRMPKV